MKTIEIEAFAKVNLCLDVRGLMENGYHEIAMILQQIRLHDIIGLKWSPADLKSSSGDPGVDIRIVTDRDDLSTGKDNLAWKAAHEMIKLHRNALQGTLTIEIEKNIPMAAGLAGGSSDCAAVIHGLNVLWDMGMDIGQLCDVGAGLGSDVPFCIMGQAAASSELKGRFAHDRSACHCAIATGRGTDLEPIPGLRSHIVLSKPGVSVSTAEAYRGIDDIHITSRPNIAAMRRALESGNTDEVVKKMINVLEKFTLKHYPIVVYTKDKMQEMCNRPPLMSGSGPTVYCLCDSKQEAEQICLGMKELNAETYLTETTY